MTDTPPVSAALPDPASGDEPFWGRLDGDRARSIFGVAYVVAVVATAMSAMVVSSVSPERWLITAV